MSLTRRLNPNGDFAVWQMGLANPSADHGVITADAYYLQNTSGAVLRVEKSADAPSFADAGFVVRQSMKITVLTAANPSETENAGIVHTGTGDRFAQMLLGRAPVRSLFMKASGPFHIILRTAIERSVFHICCGRGGWSDLAQVHRIDAGPACYGLG